VCRCGRKGLNCRLQAPFLSQYWFDNMPVIEEPRVFRNPNLDDDDANSYGHSIVESFEQCLLKRGVLMI